MTASDSYTVKERVEQLAHTIAEQFGSIIRQLDSIEEKLDKKASVGSVEALERRINDIDQRLERRMVSVELAAAGVAAVSTFQRWLVGVVGVGCIGAIATLVWLATGGH